MESSRHSADTSGRRSGHTAPRGQFFTLDAVARFLWRVVGLLSPTAPPWRVVDLAAGEGALLDSGYAGGWTRPGLAFGLEIDPAVIGTPREGTGKGRRDIIPGDGLFDWPDVWPSPPDVVVGNPPFGRSRDLLTGAQGGRLEAEGQALLPVWGPRARTSTGRLRPVARSCRVEQLFLTRALDLVRPDGGLVAYIVPDGVLSNVREQVARDWLSRRARLLAAIALPASAFRRCGLNAQVHLILLGRASCPQSRPALLVERRHAGRGRLAAVLDEIFADLQRLHDGEASPGTVGVDTKDLAGRRWDPAFWVGRRALTAWCREGEDSVDLGDFIELLTYGPIVTGGAPDTVAEGVLSIRQGDFGETGLHLQGALRVVPDSPHDPPRSRVRAGDLLMPRSGGGALGRNRVAVYPDHGPAANIGCFVDLIRLRPGLNSYDLWVFLRSCAGWGQIRSLINGVGTPNLSFRAIRSLRVPLLDAAEQAVYEADYRRRVLPLHDQAVAGRPGAAEAAQKAFGVLVRRLEQRLQCAGSPASVGAEPPIPIVTRERRG